ncbi:MAG: hypothetical protein FJ265_23145, partial [Planctomycetes bacterium]|nr:hypothetical protein [Planctomycetota bacterium]
GEAILLLGPTGSGKTPLGGLLAARGLGGRRCVHFDFGAELRRVAAGAHALPTATVAFVQRVLREGLLLENESFPIARAVFDAFRAELRVAPADLVVLNGLPRHAGQARDVATIADIVLVVALECSAATVHARIRRDSGGDRAGRDDDSIGEVAKKLAIYAARTEPLLDHYRRAGVPCRVVSVGVDTSAADVLEALALPG